MSRDPYSNTGALDEGFNCRSLPQMLRHTEDEKSGGREWVGEAIALVVVLALFVAFWGLSGR